MEGLAVTPVFHSLVGNQLPCRWSSEFCLTLPEPLRLGSQVLAVHGQICRKGPRGRLSGTCQVFLPTKVILDPEAGAVTASGQVRTQARRGGDAALVPELG